MIINGNGGESVGNLVDTSFRLNSNHYFYQNSQKNYLEIPNIQLSRGRVNSLLVYLNSDQTDRFGNGCIYNMFHTLSYYDNGVTKMNGRVYYIDPTSGSFGSSSPLNVGDGTEIIYDASTQKVSVFLPFYSNNVFILGGFTYSVEVW